MPEESGAVPPGNCVAANWKYTYLPWGGVDLLHQRFIIISIHLFDYFVSPYLPVVTLQ